MNHRRPLAALLLSAATVAALAVPAGAAVPKRPANQTIPCDDGTGKSAQVWHWAGHLAATNPCSSWWLLMPWGSSGDWNGSYAHELELAPGAHFSWNRKQLSMYAGSDSRLITGGRRSDLACGDGETSALFVYSYKDVRSTAPGC